MNVHKWTRNEVFHCGAALLCIMRNFPSIISRLKWSDQTKTRSKVLQQKSSKRRPISHQTPISFHNWLNSSFTLTAVKETGRMASKRDLKLQFWLIRSLLDPLTHLLEAQRYNIEEKIVQIPVLRFTCMAWPIQAVLWGMAREALLLLTKKAKGRSCTESTQQAGILWCHVSYVNSHQSKDHKTTALPKCEVWHCIPFTSITKVTTIASLLLEYLADETH